MSPHDTLNIARDLLTSWSTGFNIPEANRLDMTLEADNLLAAITALCNSHWGYLAAITGLDDGPVHGTIEVLYHFCAGAAVLTLRVRVNRNGAHLSSICQIIPSASVFERETSEMLGVIFKDTPDTRRLFLPDDWPDNVYPLRKDALTRESGDLPQEK